MSFIEKLVNELKANNIEILPPIKIDGGAKIGMGGTHQYSVDSDDPVALFAKLLSHVQNNKIQFAELVLPSQAVAKAEMHEQDNVVIRYLKVHLPPLVSEAEMATERWDALINVA